MIAKNLDVIIKDGDDQRRLFSHTGPPGEEIVAVMEAARRQARELGVGLRVYEMQPHEQTICEHNPVQSLFFNWEGQVSPCITLSYADSRYFDGQMVHVPCLHFGDIRQQALPEIWESPAYRAFRQAFEDRLRWQRHSLMDMMLDGAIDELPEIPSAPESCRSCYYLYGV